MMKLNKDDFSVGSYHTYRLRIAIHNLRSGKVVWEGIQTRVKF